MPANPNARPREGEHDKGAAHVVARINAEPDDHAAAAIEAQAVENTDKAGTAAEEKASAKLDQTPGPVPHSRP